MPVEKELFIHFKEKQNKIAHTLYLRQYDVKQVWRIFLNGHVIDSLIVDGNDMKTYFQLSPGTLVNGENILNIQAAGDIIDDIMVGEIVLDHRAPEEVLSEAAIDLDVVDSNNNKRIP